MSKETLFVLEDNLQKQHQLLPKLEALVTTHLTGKAMKALIFLLHKTSDATRIFNKKKSGNRARERVKILENLNSVLQNSDSIVHEIEDVEKNLQNSMQRTFDKLSLKTRIL